jgi:hypothetical protein
MLINVEHEGDVYQVAKAAPLGEALPLGAGEEYTWHLKTYRELPGMGCIFAPADRGSFGLYKLTEWSEDSPIQYSVGPHLLIEERNKNGQAKRYISDSIEVFKNSREFELFIRGYLLGKKR